MGSGYSTSELMVPRLVPANSAFTRSPVSSHVQYRSCVSPSLYQIQIRHHLGQWQELAFQSNLAVAGCCIVKI